MAGSGSISINDYDYELPADRIASYPLAERDSSKLLIYREGKIETSNYKHITGYLPEGSLLVFNNSRVINARLKFPKESGGEIEIFCLEPAAMSNFQSQAMQQQSPVQWKCLVGNLRKSSQKKFNLPLSNSESGGIPDKVLSALLLEKKSDEYLVEFSWSAPGKTFSEMLRHAGETPLPPYIKRKAEAGDTERYQTVYANEEGSVAAPTAGLHFTEEVMNTIAGKNIASIYITLHVGAGTFKPVKASLVENHEMHAEWLEVDIATVTKLQSQAQAVIAVGTTSVRTVETMYWLGVKCVLNGYQDSLFLGQWEVYQPELAASKISVKDAFTALGNWLSKRNLKKVSVQTKLLIMPGYRFRVINGIVTNFHQPRSTLLLLVAAATNGKWRKLYDFAMQHEFRFLSYGDGSLIML